jgi:hypothetical protein
VGEVNVVFDEKNNIIGGEGNGGIIYQSHYGRIV